MSLSRDDLVRAVEDSDQLKLETEKLRLEISELNKTFLLRPGFWLALIPVLIAFGGAIQVYRSDIFDITRERLELKTERLKSEEIKLAQRVADAEVQFTARRNQLQEEERELREDFAEKAAELDRQNQLMVSENQTLKNEQLNLVLQRDKLQAQIDILNKTVAHERKVSGVRDNIAILRACIDNGRIDCEPYHPSAEVLIDILKEDGSEAQVQFVEDAIGNESRDGLRTLLIAVLYIANPTPELRRRLLLRFQSASKDAGTTYWNTFGEVPWNYIERDWAVAFEAWQIILTVARTLDLDDEALIDIGLAFKSGHDDNMLEVFSDKEVFFYGLKRALQIVRNDSFSGSLRSTGFRFLGALYPDAYMAVAAGLLKDPGFDTYIKDQISKTLRNAQGSFLRALENRDFPRRVDGDWQTWLDNNEELVRAWNSADLSLARERYLKLDAAN